MYLRHSDYQFAALETAKKAGIPVILECNSSVIWKRTHWSSVRFPGAFGILKASEKYAFELADVIVVVSHEMKSVLEREGIPPGTIFVNPNGVDEEIFHPDVEGDSIRKQYGLQNKFVLVFVGTFGQWHGVEILAKAAGKIREFIPELHVLFVGDGILRTTVEEIIHNTDTDDIVTITGMVDHTEIPKYLAAGDILVSPHVNNPDGTKFFGSPTKLFEYMAMEKPIVASNVGQIGAILQNEKNARLVESRNINQLTEAVVRLYKDKKMRSSIARNARIHVLNNYTWKHNAQNVCNLFNSLIKGN